VNLFSLKKFIKSLVGGVVGLRSFRMIGVLL
jgi:hypothetical protein